MNRFTSDLSVSKRLIAPATAVVPFMRRPRPRINSLWTVGVCLLVSFAAGMAVSLRWWPETHTQAAKAPITDFQIALPEGETVVTVLDSSINPVEIGRLVMQREGGVVSGIPESATRIPARSRLSEEDAAFLRRELSGVVLATDSSWQRANKIRYWLTHVAHRIAMPGLASRVPRQEYEQMRAGGPVLCGNLAEIYAALCEAWGLTARPVGLSLQVRNGSFGKEAHAGAEVWLPEMGGWIYQDPTFDCYWEIEGRPASALMLHDAIITGREIKYAPQNSRTEAGLREHYVDPRLYFRHVSYEYKAGGPLLYFADERMEPLSLADKNWVQTSDRVDFERLDTDGNTIVERRAQIAPGVFAQLLDDTLFIRDRRDLRERILVRTSRGTVEGCAFIHRDAEGLGVFESPNLARNPSFRSTKLGGVADEWFVGGPIDAMTVAGGQAMAAEAGGKLWQRVPAQPKGSYLLYARVIVTRGPVNWTIGDSGRGEQSTGTIEPERISEVVSDVVETESGYLDIGFEVPAGGSFRVIDVVVAEAPRFAASPSVDSAKTQLKPLQARKLPCQPIAMKL
jgi:hypothetical protein